MKMKTWNYFKRIDQLSILLLHLFPPAEKLSEHIKKSVLSFFLSTWFYLCLSNWVEVIAVTVDSKCSHDKWRNTPVNNGGIANLSYSLVSDIRAYAILYDYGIFYYDSIALRESSLLRINLLYAYKWFASKAKYRWFRSYNLCNWTLWIMSSRLGKR